MARRASDLGPIPHDARRKHLQANLNAPVWADAFSNIHTTFKWH